MINPLVVNGQIQGGVAQGIGTALYEQVVYDENGQFLTGTLMDYLAPTAVDVPQVEIGHIESPSPYTPGGIKGMGEGGAIAPPAAIANAVADALAPFGVRVTEVPLTPERVLKLIDRGRLKEINHRLLLGHKRHPHELKPLVDGFAEKTVAGNIRPGALTASSDSSARTASRSSCRAGSVPACRADRTASTAAELGCAGDMTGRYDASRGHRALPLASVTPRDKA